MADAISQLYSKSSSRETKVNDQNKAGVETMIVHTNTAKTKSEMVSHIAMTKRYCNDICKKKSRNCSSTIGGYTLQEQI